MEQGGNIMFKKYCCVISGKIENWVLEWLLIDPKGMKNTDKELYYYAWYYAKGMKEFNKLSI